MTHTSTTKLKFLNKRIVAFLISSLLLGAANAAESININSEADIQTIKTNLANRSADLKVKSVKATPIPGLYEVFANGNIFYMDKSAHFVLVNGMLIDDVEKKNITEERYKTLTRIEFNQLPFQNAIEIKKGTGAYKFAVFSDPECPFCKKLEQGLEKLKVTDYTAYVFLFPLKELHPDAAQKSESIWCAKDKTIAWSDWMLTDKTPEKLTCNNPLKDNEQLADSLGVLGTPTIYLQDGSMTQSPQALIAAMNQK